MWKAIYACIVLGGTTLALANSIVSLAQGRSGFALGYVVLIILGSSTMWLVGKAFFSAKATETSGKEKESE